MQKSKQDRCKRQTTLYWFYLPSFQQMQPLWAVYHQLWARAVSRAGTAVLHSIIRLNTQFRTRNLPNSLSTNTSLGALWQTGRNVGFFLQPLSYSFICNNLLGNQVWTIFIARMPARRSSSLCSSALWIAHTWKAERAQGTAKTKAPV